MNNTKQKQNNNLYEMFFELKDYRRKQGQVHSLPIILIIVTMAIMSGFIKQRAMNDFVIKNEKELIELLKPKNDKLPKRKTIARLLENIDFNQLSNIFFKWAENQVSINKNEWLSIDGKAIAGTVENPNNEKQKFVNLVSVFANKQKQIIACKKVNNKSNEIPKVRELITMLNLKNVVFTLDALHCQKETVKTIINSNNDYCIGVKGNQKKLHKQLKKT